MDHLEQGCADLLEIAHVVNSSLPLARLQTIIQIQLQYLDYGFDQRIGLLEDFS